MVHEVLFKLKGSVISLKENKFQKKSLKFKMLKDRTSTSDVSLSGEDDGSQPSQNGFCMFGDSCSKKHNNTLCNNTICKRHKRNLRHQSVCKFKKIEMLLRWKTLN